MKQNRRQQILEVLASELETKPGSRITTANLAKAVGVSEAALYRHFASKAQMFEALIEFAEETIFGLTNRIIHDEPSSEVQCFQITNVVLTFAERNPGISRILIGDALIGENDRLRNRVAQIFARLETQLNEILRRQAASLKSAKERTAVAPLANLLVAIMSGRISQFVRTDFRVRPTMYWREQWPIVSK